MKNVREVFGILKNIVDKKVPVLKQRVAKGVEAGKTIYTLQGYIEDVENCIRINVCDVEYTRELKKSIEDLERKIQQLNKDKEKAVIASQELKQAKEFYRTYKQVVVYPEIKRLKERYDRLDSKLFELDDKIFACEINMDPSHRSEDVCLQSENDLKYYNLEYARIMEERNNISYEINQLSR